MCNGFWISLKLEATAIVGTFTMRWMQCNSERGWIKYILGDEINCKLNVISDDMSRGSVEVRDNREG